MILGAAAWSTSASAAAPLERLALPTKPCSETWKLLIQKGLHHFNFTQDSYNSYAARVKRTECYKDWTILVYMAADNDLTPYALMDLHEMEAGFKGEAAVAGSTLKSDLVVHLDTQGRSKIRRLHIFQSSEVYDPKQTLETIQKQGVAGIRSPVAAFLPDKKIPEETKLKHFLEWGTKNYPAKHYMVIVWGHGQGWAPAPTPPGPVTSRFLNLGDTQLDHALTASSDKTPRLEKGPFSGRNFGGLAFNSTQNSYLGIPSLRNALESVFDADHPLDLYASDACLMQMAEVATEISSVTRFITGSTQVQNFLGLPYRRMMYELNKGSFLEARKSQRSCNSTDEACLLAWMIPRVFLASMKDNGLQGREAPEGIKSITMSSISSSELRSTLNPALDRLSEALLRYLTEDHKRTIDIQFVLQQAPHFEGGAQDIGAFLTLMEILLKKEAEKSGGMTETAAQLKLAINSTRDALLRTVMNQALGTNYTSGSENLYRLGIRATSVWLPVSPEDYQNRIESFTPSEFYHQVRWQEWLATVFNTH